MVFFAYQKERELIVMLGARISDLRGRLGWSQAKLARRLNISPSTVGMYEQGRREPSADMLLSLARELGVSVEYLLTGSPGAGDAVRLSPRPAIGKEDKSLIASLRSLSRDELLVLLTAELLGEESEEF